MNNNQKIEVEKKTNVILKEMGINDFHFEWKQDRLSLNWKLYVISEEFDKVGIYERHKKLCSAGEIRNSQDLRTGWISIFALTPNELDYGGGFMEDDEI